MKKIIQKIKAYFKKKSLLYPSIKNNKACIIGKDLIMASSRSIKSSPPRKYRMISSKKTNPYAPVRVFDVKNKNLIRLFRVNSLHDKN